jgi:predicted AAA+ superfamily ATPase
MYVKRELSLIKLLKRKSHFLLGPRSTGKTKLIENTLPDAFVINLLIDDFFSKLIRRPSLLSEIIPPRTDLVVIDEIQKIPQLLNEIHNLIETKGIKFLLTGSSARKLKRNGANLLGGRAWESHLFPLTALELGKDFSLIRYLNQGGLPAIYFSEYPQVELKNYIKLYLKEEIQEEAAVRRFDHFVRFLDVTALANGEELNFEAIASDSGVPARTVAGFFEILENTLLGFQLVPYLKTKNRKAIKRSKFYFFDVGVAGALAHRGEIKDKSELFGKAFEHFILQELRAYLSYNNLDLEMSYWRTAKQQFEVDVVLGTQLAIEIKSSTNISEKHMGGLRALREENQISSFMVVSQDPVERIVDGIRIVPWTIFLSDLAKGKLLKP